jgi:SAM-dependent methyltransferase
MTQGKAWYLDPVVANHKRQAHIALLRRWLGDAGTRRVLKTDLFEESNKTDQILFDPLFEKSRVFAFDLDFSTARDARRNHPAGAASFWAGDIRNLPLPASSIDVVISTSTLDHFRGRSDLEMALDEIARVICPGGDLVITLDNPHNPLYWGLRLASRLGCFPFFLGLTVAPKALKQLLMDKKFEILDLDLVIHNPRGLSTLLFIAVRRLAGRRADGVLSWMLMRFDRLHSLPTREWTACFVAVHARKPDR